jgi:hypothetical protein
VANSFGVSMLARAPCLTVCAVTVPLMRPLLPNALHFALRNLILFNKISAGLKTDGYLSLGLDYAETLNIWNDKFQHVWPKLTAGMDLTSDSNAHGNNIYVIAKLDLKQKPLTSSKLTLNMSR